MQPARQSKQQTTRARELRRETSKTEKRLWPRLRRAALGHPFRRQHPIGPYFLDFYCSQLKLAVEVDGPWHDIAADSQRDAHLASLGIQTMRFSVWEVDENLDSVIAAISHEMWLIENSAR